jgi:L-ascorbate metabolism protein UlaG (beta-lactamase superfamily)
MTSTTGGAVTVRLACGPTAVIEIGGLRLLTDPTFGRPGRTVGGTRTLTETRPPGAEGTGPVDVVLLYDGRYGDGLAPDGHARPALVPLVLTTPDGARRLGRSARTLPPWHHISLPRLDGGDLRVTGVPAQHGPAVPH